MVLEQGRPAGIITPHEVKAIDRGRWPYTTVGDVMRSLETLRSVGPERPVAEALEMMGREDVNQMPVVQHGSLAGIISRGYRARVTDARGTRHLIGLRFSLILRPLWKNFGNTNLRSDNFRRGPSR